ELERVAVQLRRVEVGLDGPRRDALAARLANLPELQQLSRTRRHAGLLLELAPRRRERVLPLVVFALHDRPRRVLAARPERAAHVTDQHLQATVSEAEREQPGARSGYHDRGMLDR